MTPNSKLPMGTVGIMAGLPAVLWEFTWSLAEFIQFNAHHVESKHKYIHYQPSRHSLHYVARNEFADTFHGDWLFMLDTDHGFDPDLLARMIYAAKRYQVDVASGLYLKKEYPHRPNAWKWNGEKYATLMEIPDEVLDVDAAGAGCLLIHRRVFDAIRNELHEAPFSTHEFAGQTGEDFAFFKRCKMLGINAALFPWIECHHLQVKRLTVEKDYDQTLLLPDEQTTIIGAKKMIQPNLAIAQA